VGNIAPISRLGFGGLCLQDGPLSIRQAVDASVFSAGLSVAASWDRSLAHQRGVYLATEFREKGSHVALGPVVGPLGRSPFGGRNWEGFSPDAYLSGALVEDTIVGMQSTGVQACVKHFIMNEQETQRNPSKNRNGTTIEALSSNLDDKVSIIRTINEFKLILRQRPCMKLISGRSQTQFALVLLPSCALTSASMAGKYF
jgi:beta-glucosidase